MPISFPDSVISGHPSSAPIFLELFLTQPSSRISTKSTMKVLATMIEIGVSLDSKAVLASLRHEQGRGGEKKKKGE